jgi:sugar lactone lactonase YvrE
MLPGMGEQMKTWLALFSGALLLLLLLLLVSRAGSRAAPMATQMPTESASSGAGATEMPPAPTYDLKIPDAGFSGINPNQEFVATDEEGNAYIAHRGGNIVKLSPEGIMLATWSPEFSSSPGPEGIAVDAGGRIYVSDSGRRRIMVLSPGGNLLTAWEVPGDSEPRHSHLLAVDGQGNVYMTHYRSNRVLKYSSTGKLLTEWAAYSPTGVAADRDGNIYVVDHSYKTPAIQKYSATGRLLARVGEFGEQPGNLKNPERVAVDEQGNVYVSDGDNRRIQKLSPEGKPLAIWQTGVFYPAGLAVDRQGNIYVGGWNKSTADDSPYMIKISPEGRVLTVWR